jgi:hypothetical protein
MEGLQTGAPGEGQGEGPQTGKPGGGRGAGQAEILLRRVLGGAPQLAQVWFRAAVLDRYRSLAGYRVIRTDTVGRVRGAQWMVDFGIAGEGDGLIHLSAGELAGSLPEAERAHWAQHLETLPTSANYLLMQATRGACIDDGDVRAW